MRAGGSIIVLYVVCEWSDNVLFLFYYYKSTLEKKMLEKKICNKLNMCCECMIKKIPRKSTQISDLAKGIVIN